MGIVVEQEVSPAQANREPDGVDLQRALYPQRPPETLLNTMETSLSRLPSFRIIAGWAVLTGGLIAAFLLTH